MGVKNFIDECKKKDVFKLISIYVVSTWVMLQVLSVIWQPLGLPEKSVTILIILLLAGFPIYLFYIWKFRLHISEDKMEQYEEKKAAKKNAFKKHYFGVLITVSILSIIAIGLILKANFFQENKTPSLAVTTTDKIAVLKFGNNTGDPSFDVVSKMTADWIIHGINEKQVAQVISPEILSNYMEMNDGDKNVSERSVLTQFLNPSKIVSGNFFLNDNELVFQGSIQSGAFSETLISFKPQRCNSDSPLDCVENLKQLVISYLFLETAPQDLNLQETPPKFNAYQSVIDAKANYDSPELYISLLEKAIRQDSSYFEPKVLQVAYYYGEREYVKADSLFRNIRPSNYKNKRQLNLLNHYEALLSGQNDKVYETIKKEYSIAPFDLQTNSSTMVVALQFVNRPQDVLGFYEDVNTEPVDLENCPFCRTRMYVNALAAIEQQDYNRALAITSPLYQKNDLFINPWIAANIRTGNIEDVKAYNRDLSPAIKIERDILLESAYELKRLGKQKEIAEITNQVISTPELLPSTRINLLFLADNFKGVIEVADQFKETLITDEVQIPKIAIAYYRLGNTEKALSWLNELEKFRKDYQFGAIDYAIAQYYAGISQKDKMLEFLGKSVKSGMLFKSRTFKNDPVFKEYYDDPEFNGILQYWSRQELRL